MLPRRVVDYGVYVAVRLLIGVVQALRIETCQRLSALLARLFSDVLKIRRQVVDENIKQAFPQLTTDQRRAMALRMWEHLFLMVAEVAQARRKIHRTNWHQYIQFRGDAQTARALLDERPTVIVSGHFGNFEISGYFLGLFGFPTYTVARTLDNPYLDRFINRFRGTTGQYMLPKSGSAKRISVLLERGATLALLGDQHAGEGGCWVDFFGRPASTHKAIALFSLAAGAPLLVNYCRRLDRPLVYESGLEGIADPADVNFQLTTVPAMTEWYTRQLEAIVRRAPEQYWWLHRRWKGQPPRGRVRRKRRANPRAA